MAKSPKAVKSQAQQRLVESLEDWFPFSRVRQEVYIGELVEARGFTMQEIGQELGSRPHRLFCDIVMSDSDGDFVFEYHGEQHYHQIGGMTDTMADLNLNQHLDREKSWILERIGVPLVAVPYDMYVDASVAARLMEEASRSVEEAQAKLYSCDGCGRRFPSNLLSGGLCRKCLELERQRVERRFEEERLANRAMLEEELEPDSEQPYDPSEERDDDWEERRKAEQKAKAKEARKEAYRRWKESPEYQRRKDAQKAARRAAYQEMKRRRKEARHENGDE